MIKRTLYFGNATHLSTTKEQLVINYQDQPKKTVPLEDIGVVVIDHYQITFSSTLMSKLLAQNAAVVTCDARHMPQGLMLNLEGSHTQQEHFRVQLEANQYMKDRFWQQTISAKIANQARLLQQVGIPNENMIRWATKVRSGDVENLESRAAAYHWKHLFVDHLQSFKRGREEGEPNNLLNYGYAILRATVARALVASGLLPTFGYHHRNKYNAYALADDVMEPYRPFVDEVVLELVRSLDDYSELTPAIKAELLKIPALDVKLNGQVSPLMVAVQQTTSSLYKCYSKESDKIKFPEM